MERRREQARYRLAQDSSYCLKKIAAARLGIIYMSILCRFTPLFMIIHITNSQRTLKIPKESVQTLVKAVIAFEKQSCEEVTIHFISKPRICELHALYFDDPSPTDCISFPMDESTDAPYRVLGEIFVCPQVAKEYAVKHQIDPYEELSLYIIHGLLHLMGYNDIDVRERALMRKAERRHIDNLKQLKLNLGS